jgi:hypothetical protein
MHGIGDLPIQSPAWPAGCGGYGRFGFVLAGLLLQPHKRANLQLS